MNVTVITAPLVQLNSPYPSGAYLSAFFKSLNHNCTWLELSNQLFYSIFSREGLTKLFELSEKKALLMADKAEKNGDENTAFNIRRYISTKNNWINWIDDIVAILCGRSREKEHQFLFSPFAPRGNRMENFLSQFYSGENQSASPSVDDVRFLCSYALADLSDYITAVFDPEFSLIRYAEHLTVDERSFSQIEKNLNSPVMEHFFKPVLQRVFAYDLDQVQLFCISIPFAGTFLPALYAASFLKQKFGQKALISIGGGFVNTELRSANDPSLAKYVDFISYDRGYGSYNQLFSRLAASETERKPVYKLRQFIKEDDGKITIIEPVWKDAKMEAYESEMTSKIIPDYSDVDFSLYPRVCDDKNPMHRMWNDGAWIKAYLAHGCYWHKCAFCDTQLDYVCGYRPVQTEALYEGLLKTAREKGVYGIHFVDEALPPKLLVQFGLLNARHGNPLYYWGNVRFEKAFTKDTAAFLSYCGFGSASAGLEVATGEGLKAINKGVDIDSIVSACAAFKEAGILVHAYMIYGFWLDTPQSIINSMETLRQFFAAGLLDSSFWHKFVLTRNSQVYMEWSQGQHKDLIPLEDKSKSSSIFASNNLHFKNESDFDKFGPALDSALEAWMHGQKLETRVTKWFNFPVPNPTIPKDFIEKCIEQYEASSSQFNLNKGELYWLGSAPVCSGGKLTWLYLQEEFAEKGSAELSELLTALSPQTQEDSRQNALVKIKKSPELQKQLQRFHNIGLVIV